MNEPQGNFYELDFGARSHLGRRRKNNEDYVTFFVPDDPEVRSSQGSLFIVADGVGGASKGEYASQFAAEKVVYEYYNQRDLPPAQRLVQCIQLASREIYNFTQNSSIITRMASTLVAALVIRNQLYVANVGDSRAYLIRGGKIRQVSRDHSLVGELIDQGLMNEQQASTSKTKNKLTRSVGGDAEVEVDLFGPIPLHLGDRLLLCTDGLTRYAMQEDLLRMAGQEEPAQVVKKLQEFALLHGGADNVSSILLETVVKSKTTLKAPIQHVGRVTTPEWQRVSTDYPHLDQIRSKTPAPYLPVVIAVMSVVAVIALFGAGFLVLNKMGVFQTPTESVSPVVTTTPPMETNPPQEGVPQSPEIGQESDGSVPAQNDGQVISGKKDSDGTTQNDNGSVPTQMPNGNDNVPWQCVVKISIQDSNGLNPMLDSLVLPFDNGKTYTEYNECKLINQVFTCNEPQPVNGDTNFEIHVGSWLVLYTFPGDGNDQWSMQKCKDIGTAFFRDVEVFILP